MVSLLVLFLVRGQRTRTPTIPRGVVPVSRGAVSPLQRDPVALWGVFLLVLTPTEAQMSDILEAKDQFGEVLQFRKNGLVIEWHSPTFQPDKWHPIHNEGIDCFTPDELLVVAELMRR